ncbi:carbon storage regulator [Lignipirellula cremea]|uniref:Translational regulator CsrA n=1 Tax=Lignipirellula cremea TaxID=2528010 RepID=A0A518DW35_9BACT|nr:carbon storage regulator [Lignipirellula cremea]QDU96048.1 hypothetical protein Pla8534_38670 [Lignipirellula cremea]
MLVLSRKIGEEIVIGNGVRIVVNRIAGNRVSIGVTAPGDVSILRGELEAIANAFSDASEGPEEIAEMPAALCRPAR